MCSVILTRYTSYSMNLKSGCLLIILIRRCKPVCISKKYSKANNITPLTLIVLPLCSLLDIHTLQSQPLTTKQKTKKSKGLFKVPYLSLFTSINICETVLKSLQNSL